MKRALLLAIACAGCAAGVPPATPSAPSVQATPPPADEGAAPSEEAMPQAVEPGDYELELLGDAAPFGEGPMHLSLRREDGILEAKCSAGRTLLAGSGEGDEMARSAPRPAAAGKPARPLAVSLMGLSSKDDAPVALRLMADTHRPGELTGTAVVEQGGRPIMLRFIARRRKAAPPAQPLCGELVNEYETHYYGPVGQDHVITERYERCVKSRGKHAHPSRDE